MSIDLLSLFGAGLLTFLTPCVLPLIPIYLAALMGGDIKSLGKQRRGQLMGRAGLFSIGFIGVFTLLGLGASTIGTAMQDNKTLLQIGGALLIAVFGLKFLGLVQIPLLDRVVKADDDRLQTRFSGVNALVMGVVFAAGWSPCVGPVLGSVLTYTAGASSDPLTGAVYLAVYGAGFAAPLLLTAAFSEVGLGLLRRLHPYLPRLERATGVLLLLFAALLVRDVSAEVGASASAGAAGAPALAELGLEGSEEGKPALPVMVELYAKDCAICKRMKPVVDDLIDQCDQNGVRVTAIDVSEADNASLASKVRLVGVPTFLFLDPSGNEVARLVGEQTPDTLRQGLAALTGGQCATMGRYDGPSEDQASSDSVARGSEPPAAQPGAACPSGPESVKLADMGAYGDGSSPPGAIDEPDPNAVGHGACTQDML
jgi:cytochrome c-type biogenesis protein